MIILQSVKSFQKKQKKSYPRVADIADLNLQAILSELCISRFAPYDCKTRKHAHRIIDPISERHESAWNEMLIPLIRSGKDQTETQRHNASAPGANAPIEQREKAQTRK